MGAHSVGVTEVKDYHLYTHAAVARTMGHLVDLDHKYALALTVEMDKDMVDRAPRSPTAMESALQYVRSGVMAVQIADLIRRLGYTGPGPHRRELPGHLPPGGAGRGIWESWVGWVCS